MPHRIYRWALGFTAAGSLCCGMMLCAQVQVGNETQVSLSGSVGTGYSGSMTNEGANSHGFTFGGSGNLTGSYYSPQFLSFNVSPFFNQSRNNSTYQSVTDSSGVTASANLFGGSEFPGYFNYSRIYNSESTYSLPGIGNYATNGNSQTFGVGWSANLKTLPSLSFGYQQGTSDYSLYGLQQDSLSDFHSVFGTARYTVDGFHLSGGIHYSNTSTMFPEVVLGQSTQKVTSDSTTYTLSMGRSLPLSGSTTVNFTRNTTGYDSLWFQGSEESDIISGGLSLKPTSKLTTQLSMDYNDNLAGSISQEVSTAGAIVPVSIPGEPSHSWGFLTGAQYALFSGLYASGTISHREQLFLGASFDSNAYSGSLNFGHHLLGGQFSAGSTVTYSAYPTGGQSMRGMLSNAIYIRKVGLWGVSGSFGYSQNVQTILIAYTSSGYSYSVSANRPVGRVNWTGGASGARSMLSGLQGTTNVAQSYSTGLSGRWLGVSGAYSKSSGIGLFTPTGIANLPPGVPPTLVSGVLYGGRTYSAGVGSSPIRGLTINGSYVNSRSNTANGSLASNNKTEQAFVYLNYRFRKVYFNAGYSRLLQGFSGSTQNPALLSTYYFGISRWFKAF